MSDLKAVSVVECYIQRSVDDELFKGGLYHFSRNLIKKNCPCHNFFPLSSVQIIIIPACWLLCVL